MWLRNLAVGVAVVVWAILSSASAQQPVRWQWSLENAKQLAGQTNRLVVVHFWADWCSPCKRMEQDVFSRPEVGAALEANYVAVKLHKDHFPATAREFGVTAIPADVIITPQGQVVERFQGYTDANQYVGRLNRVAANYRVQNGRMFAQMPGQPAAPAVQPDAAMPSSGNWAYQPTPGPGYPPPAAGRQALADHRPPDSQAQPAQATTLPAYPPYAGRPSAMQPEPPRSPYGQREFPTQDPLLSRREAPAAQAIPGLPPQEYSLAGPVRQPSMTPSPSPSMPAAQNMQPWQPALPDSSPMAGAPPAEPPAMPAAEVPPGNPPLALDGYCPVQLTEKERWVRGNPKWGVRHEGRTYLFAGPEEQSRFYSQPERFAPVLGGEDVVLLLEQGEHVSGRREHGGWFQGRVYLFVSEASFQKFFADPHRYANAVAKTKANVANRPEDGRPSAGSQQAAPWMGPQPSAAATTPYYP